MANSLRLPMASPLCFSSSSSMPSLKRHRFIATNSSKMPMPPFNPNDPFISRLASVAAESPEKLVNSSRNSDAPPFLDLYEPPQLMAGSMHVRGASMYGRPRRPPPDLPSIILDGRVVYIGMPLVPAVSELVCAQLMYLASESNEPIYLYINSTGTTRDDGEPIAMESEGFAIYDLLTLMDIEIRTVNVGAAIGQACLLLAAGAKGRRYSLRHAQAMIQQPRLPPTGLLQASDVDIRARQLVASRDKFVRLFAKHTGNSEELVANTIRRTFHMDVVKAIDFGVIDKVFGAHETILTRDQVVGDAPLPVPEREASNRGLWS